ncbi:GNAT family N-acetyltransferase [Streptomyces anulatus]|uniref:GNAT family N-acetyltransferase n=1 Tax=Streptomyces anulatus TaxID=1892 RepID=UPI002B1CC66D|nr:GNAT family N-acetyltransferase [Streptomyces anulatus]
MGLTCGAPSANTVPTYQMLAARSRARTAWSKVAVIPRGYNHDPPDGLGQGRTRCARGCGRARPTAAFGAAELADHLRPDAGETELGFLFLPEAWGFGYAAEARASALGWFAAARPGEPVVLCTRTANSPSMRLARTLGFIEVTRFEEYGAEQWLGMWSPVGPTG